MRNSGLESRRAGSSNGDCSTGDAAYRDVFDARNGRLLERRDLVASDYYQYMVWAETTGSARPVSTSKRR